MHVCCLNKPDVDWEILFDISIWTAGKPAWKEVL